MPYRPERSPLPALSLAEAFAQLAAATRLSLPPPESADEAAAVAALLRAAGPQLAAKAAPNGLLARLCGDRRFEGETGGRGLPKTAHAALAKGEAFAAAEGDLWIIEPNGDGSYTLSHAHVESHREVAPRLADWLAAEAAALAPKSKARSPKAAEGKPAIDALVAALASLCGADVAATLSATPAQKRHTRWEYAVAAVAACGPVWSPALLAATEGRLLHRVLRGRLFETDDETCIVEPDDDELDGINPIVVKRYPKAARKLLLAGHIVAADGPEVWLILRKADGEQMSWGITLYHLAPEGFEELAPSVEAWLAGELERARAQLAG
jgi:hypothetical protein